MLVPRLPILLCFLIAALQATDNAIYPLLLRTLRNDLWPDQDPTWLPAAYALGAAIIPVSVSLKAPVWLSKSGTWFGLLGLCVSAAGLALKPDFAVAVLLRALAGGSSGLISASLLVSALEIGAGAVAAMTAGFLAAVVAGVPAGAKLVARFGLESLFIATAATALALAVFSGLTFPRPTQPLGSPRGFGALFSERRLARALISTVAAAAAIGGATTLLPSLLQSPEHAGLSIGQTANLYFLASVGPLLGGLLSPLVLKRRPAAGVAYGGALCLTPILLALPVAADSFVAATLILGGALLIETLRRSGLQTLMGELVTAPDRPRYLTLRALLVQLGLAGGIPLAAQSARHAGIMFTAAAMAVLMTVAAFTVPRST